MDKLVVQQKIESLLCFFEPFLRLANWHMVDFFINPAYKNLLPSGIQKEMMDTRSNSFTNCFFNKDFSGAPHLQHFMDSCEKFTLKNCRDICLPLDDFIKKIQKLGCKDLNSFKLEMFMTMKKSHEVEILTGVVASTSKLSKTSHVVDLGDGKGYLSSILALHNQIPVMGVDASNINTCGANQRAHKLSRVWNNIPKAPHKSYPKKNDNASSENINLYKQITAFVDENFNLEKLVFENFPDAASQASPLRLGLVGLHTCGDLAPNSLKIFSGNSSVKFICNVGCCYHLLTERYDTNPGFPMSEFLKGKQSSIGKNARMIANQSVDRILHNRELPNITIFYRALFQILLVRHCPQLPIKHVGKFKKPPKNFVEYVRVASKRLEINFNIADQELEEFYSSNLQRLTELNNFYLLRCRLAPVVESLILLDRLLFLKEQNIEFSFLVQLFDPVVSPRCYGIVALKEIK